MLNDSENQSLVKSCLGTMEMNKHYREIDVDSGGVPLVTRKGLEDGRMWEMCGNMADDGGRDGRPEFRLQSCDG